MVDRTGTERREGTPDAADRAGPDLSIVIPAYNEARRLPVTLARIFEYLDARKGSWETIVSDDASTDGTAELVARDFPRCRLVRAKVNQGKGGAVRDGMLAARGRLRLFTDADLSTPIEELGGMIEALESGGYDVVIASRALPQSRLVVHQPWWREMSGRFFNRLARPISGLPIRDTQCGFKLFRAEAARDVFARQRSTRWAFDVEILMLARRLGYRILEHPVQWINDTASKVSLMHDAPRMLWDILVFRRRMARGFYDQPVSRETARRDTPRRPDESSGRK